jgi:hypothetical protein
MLNLHAPFRRASPEDADAISGLSPGAACGPETRTWWPRRTGDHGVPVGPARGRGWRIEAVAGAPERVAELGRRILAVADALAAEEAAGP